MLALLSALPEELKRIHEEIEFNGQISHGGFVARVGHWLGQEVVTTTVGVGKALSAASTQWIIDRFSPRAVLFAGLAGALADDLRINDVVVGSDCVYHDLDTRALGFQRGAIPHTDYRFIQTNANLNTLALKASGLSGKIRAGRILTGDQFITEKGDQTLNTLLNELKGDVIEMEGASIALVCSYNDTPCLILRTVSDQADGSASTSFLQALENASENAYLVLKQVAGSFGQSDF